MEGQVRYLREFIGQHKPEVSDRLVFTEYNDTRFQKKLLTIVQTMMYIVIILLFVLESYKPSPSSPFYHYIVLAKSLISPILMVMSIIFYILQTIVGNNAAFEMYINNELVFSKLAEGRYLYESELLQLLDCNTPTGKGKEKTD